MNLVHAYHAYCAGDWEQPVQEHCWALKQGGYDGLIILGLVGPPDQRSKVYRTFDYLFPTVRTVEADEGWEQVTLNEVARHAAKHGGAVLYCHTKGSANPATHQDAWRQSMTIILVEYWRDALKALEDVDAVGCHWLPPDDTGLDAWIFGGNFWMATCAYLRCLPPVGQAARHDAETWIGQGSPRVLDVLPGRPPTTTPMTPIGRLVVPL